MEKIKQIRELTRVNKSLSKNGIVDNDIIQITSEKILKKINSGIEIDNIYTLFLKIAKDEHRNELKKEKHYKPIDKVIEETIPEKRNVNLDKRLKLITAIVSNEIHSNKLLAVFNAYFMELKKQETIASELNVSLSTIEKSIHRIKEILKSNDTLKGLLHIESYNWVGIPVKKSGGKSSYQTIKEVTLKNGSTQRIKCNKGSAVDTLPKYLHKKALRQIDKARQTKAIEYKKVLPYHALTPREIIDKAKIPKSIITNRQIENRYDSSEIWTNTNKAVNNKPLYIKMFAELCQSAPTIEHLHLLDKDMSNWLSRNVAA